MTCLCRNVAHPASFSAIYATSTDYQAHPIRGAFLAYLESDPDFGTRVLPKFKHDNAQYDASHQRHLLASGYSAERFAFLPFLEPDYRMPFITQRYPELSLVVQHVDHLFFRNRVHA